MPVRTAYAGAAVTGEVLTAAKVNGLPGGWIGYAEVTADQGGITTEADLTGLTVTVTVGASRRLRIEVCTSVLSAAAADSGAVSIKEGTTQFATRALVFGKANTLEGLTCSAVITPAAGAHTYKATFVRTTGSGTLIAGASASQPAYIFVEDVGPA